MVDKWLTPTCFNFNINISAPTPAPAPTVQDCLGAIPVCQNVYVETNSYSGVGNVPDEIDPDGPSCMNSGEKNDVWYTFTTQTSGNICFTIDPIGSDDYDWAVYNLT
ncbi:MAG TPA: hypothetical protein PK833_00105, partial [Vicingus sp.]|nr:hypothetical protein [Vicingus sp.]